MPGLSHGVGVGCASLENIFKNPSLLDADELKTCWALGGAQIVSERYYVYAETIIDSTLGSLHAAMGFAEWETIGAKKDRKRRGKKGAQVLEEIRR